MSWTKRQNKNTWKFEAYRLTITVHRHMHFEGWLLSTSPSVFNKHSLDADSVEEAKAEALETVLEWLRDNDNIIGKQLNG